ncbi:MAG TPA: PAS domain-containing protein, partial [Candidatus Saccharimonadales bacterium]|nr:PAS domain-containing protein [Candidatus Saccharimonadales bacterium]
MVGLNITYLIAAAVAVIVIVALVATVIFRRRRRPSGQGQNVTVTGGLAISAKYLNNQKWRSDFILTAIQDGVVMVSKDNIIHVLNPAASDIIGWPPKDAMGLDF